MSKIEVKKGQEVQPGDVIGLEGQTGWATGPHVHFETRVFGIPINPRTFVVGNP
jgi:murein DD-endopeptidase MepM/ murein hydrolase activator NlpD